MVKRSGSLLSHLTHSLARSRDRSASQAPFISQTARYMSLPLSGSDETSPRGSDILASLAKIPLLVSVAFSGGTVMLRESFSLFHGSPRILENVPCGTPNCCLA